MHIGKEALQHLTIKMKQQKEIYLFNWVLVPEIAREVAELQGDVSGVRPGRVLPRTRRPLREKRFLQLPAHLTDDGGFPKVRRHLPQILDCNIEGWHDFSGQSIRRPRGRDEHHDESPAGRQA
jgi:hypothetical protein